MVYCSLLLHWIESWHSLRYLLTCKIISKQFERGFCGNSIFNVVLCTKKSTDASLNPFVAELILSFFICLKFYRSVNFVDQFRCPLLVYFFFFWSTVASVFFSSLSLVSITRGNENNNICNMSVHQVATILVTMASEKYLRKIYWCLVELSNK